MQESWESWEVGMWRTPDVSGVRETVAAVAMVAVDAVAAR